MNVTSSTRRSWVPRPAVRLGVAAAYEQQSKTSGGRFGGNYRIRRWDGVLGLGNKAFIQTFTHQTGRF